MPYSKFMNLHLFCFSFILILNFPTCSGKPLSNFAWKRCGDHGIYRNEKHDVLECVLSLQWLYNERDGVSNHQPHDCLFKSLFRRIRKKTSKLRVIDLCAGNSPVTGEFNAQRASNTENVSIWWRHHDSFVVWWYCLCCHDQKYHVAFKRYSRVL